MTQLTGLLDAAATRPVFLAVLGAPGIGKTTLLAALAESALARGFGVVRPGPGRTLLGHSLLSDDDAAPTQVLMALDRLATRAPVLVLIDRVDRWDDAGRRRLTALIRHVAQGRISVVLAARGEEPPAGIASEITRLRLGPLRDADAARMADMPRGRPRMETLRRGAGNPLALLGGQLPDEYAERLTRLPPTTRRLLVYAALAGEAEPVDVINRAGGGREDLSDWQPAEVAGLLTIADGRVQLAHPLLRASLAGSVTPRDARLAHHTLACGTADPLRRAMHRAAAATEPRETLAAALETAARHAVPLDAGRALQTAGELSPDRHDAARRYAKAVLAACHAGEPAWAIDLYRRVITTTADSALLAMAATGAALALIQTARPEAAFDLVQRAAGSRPLGTESAVTMVSMAATAVLLSGNAAHRRLLPEILDRVEWDAESHTDGAGDLRPVARAFARAVAGTGADPGPAAEMDGFGEPAQMLYAGTSAWLRDDSARAVTLLSAGWYAQNRAGTPGPVIVQLPQLIVSLMDVGRWREADQMIEQAERLAAISGATLLDAALPALRATLRASQGTGRPGPLRPPPDGNAFVAALHHRASGLTRLAAGDHEGAYAHFRALFDDSGDPLHQVLGPLSIPHLAFTAVQTGNSEHAAAAVAACRLRAGDRLSRRRAMLFDHATALIDDSEAHYRRAVRDPDCGLLWPLEYAEVLFTYGVWLRRRRRTRESTPHLKAALDIFLRLGAKAHAEQARRYVPGGDDADVGTVLAGLTAQKQRIVRMAADGLKNTEIAQRLRMSPRTVASHLYGIYPRLGVSSRHQLRGLLTDTRKA